MNQKIIVTNLTVLKSKYGAAGLQKIQAAVTALATADLARGVKTKLIAVDNAAAMLAVHGSAVTSAKNARQNKNAVDAIFRTLTPEYILILGAPDVIPHQDLVNPMFGPDDPDKLALGDIPYACEASYSKKPEDFIGPTRVVGRLPDLTGGKDPSYLIGLLDTAAKWVSAPSAVYQKLFAITAEVWQNSTSLSLQKLVGTSTGLQIAPPSGPLWTAAQLANRSHFVNCHGGSADPQFYGQRGSAYPVSHKAAHIKGKIKEGTVAAVECCYGAELYDPTLAGGQMGICSTYLAGKAYGYFGSSTIAYGPASGNGSADLLCQFFLKRILAGASLGRAALEARLEFAGGAAELDPVDLKTIAQFSLLGDPSIHPAAIAAPRAGVAAAALRAPTAKSFNLSIDSVSLARTERRRQLFARGQRIGATQPVAKKRTRAQTPQGIASALKKLTSDLNFKNSHHLSFSIQAPALGKTLAKARSFAAKANLPAPSAFHVLTESVQNEEHEFRQIKAIVAKEVDGKIVSYREMQSR